MHRVLKFVAVNNFNPNLFTMNKKTLTRTVMLLLMFVLIPWGLHAQMFEVDASSIESSENKEYNQDIESDPLLDPVNVERFLEQFVRGSSRIVGGEDVMISEYPWQTSIQLTPQYGGSHMCGGIILDDEWILTAAHCLVFEQADGSFFYLTPGHVRVRAGFTNMNSDQGAYFNAEELFVHEVYDPTDYSYDIALIRLADEMNLTEETDMAKVDIVSQEDADQGMTDPGEMVKVSGWGSLSFGGPSPDHLQAIEVPIVDVSDTAYPNHLITDDMIIAGAPGMDSCQGDSGGPMVVEDGEGWYKAAGIVSWGINCGLAQYPGVYVRVSYFEDWIRNIIETPDPNQFQIVHYETFGDGTIPAEWSNVVIEGPDGFPGWEWTDEGGAYGGQLNSTTADDGYVMVNSMAHGQHGVSEEAHLISPPIDLTGVENDILFSVEHRARTFGNADVSILMSTDGFNTETELYRWHDANPNQYNGDNPVVSEFDITDIVQGESGVQFKFKWIGSADYWWLVDDFLVRIEFPPLEVEFQVTDGEDPLSDVMLSTPYTGQETVTDENGIAYLTLYEGMYEISAYKSGYHPFVETFEVTHDGQIIHIEMELITFPEIVIDTDEINIAIPQGATEHFTVNFSNPGDGDLEFALFAYPSTGGKQSDDYVEIHHDTGYNNNGIGTGGATSFSTAARFTAEELAGYYEIYQLGAVRYHIHSDHFSQVEVKVWKGGSDSGPGNEIYSADVTDDVIPGEWSLHIMNDLVNLEAGEEYWIGYAIQTTGGHPASVDSGPMVEGKGGWMFFNNVWQELPDLNPALDFNWNIRGLIYLADEIDWLSFDPQSGIVEPETNKDIDFIFDTSGLELGPHHADVLVQNNAGESITIPVTVNVEVGEFDVTFNVTDENGAPVDDATITLGDQTNTPGDYTFEAMPVGLHAYQVEKTGYHTAEGYIEVGFEDMTVDVTLVSDDTELVTLNVSVEDEFEDAVASAFFMIDGFGGHMTDENGQIVLPMIPGTYDYSVSKTGFETVTGEVVITTDADQFLDISMNYLRFDIVVDINLDEAGTVTGGGEYLYGDFVTLTAEANEGYHFLHWFEDGQIISEDEEYEFMVTQDRHITGVFDLITYTIHAPLSGNGGMDPFGVVEVLHGEDITFTMEPLPGNHIEDVLVNNESVGAVTEYTFENVVEDGHTIHAEFALNTYVVSITSEGNGTVDPYGDITVSHGDDLHIQMFPDADHHVADILINGSSVGDDEEYLLTNITGDMTVHVVFSLSVDVADLDATPDITLYPNPARDRVTIKSSEIISVIELYHITGQRIKSVYPDAREHSLNVGQLQRGTYFLRIQYQDGVTTKSLQIR